MYVSDILRKVRVANRWTKTAKECYYRGCVCEGCIVNLFCFSAPNQKCMMKATVLGLVRVLGKPEDEECQRQIVID